MPIRRRLAAFFSDERGGTAIEYALIAVILSICITAGVIGISENLTSIFTNVNQGFIDAQGG